MIINLHSFLQPPMQTNNNNNNNNNKQTFQNAKLTQKVSQAHVVAITKYMLISVKQISLQQLQQQTTGWPQKKLPKFLFTSFRLKRKDVVKCENWFRFQSNINIYCVYEWAWRLHTKHGIEIFSKKIQNAFTVQCTSYSTHLLMCSRYLFGGFKSRTVLAASSTLPVSSRKFIILSYNRSQYNLN